jgi:hypothetical protein
MMVSKAFVPFGGVYGWLADLAVPTKSGPRTQSFYVAEPDERRAMTAIRVHAKLNKDAILTPRRGLTRKEIAVLGMKHGQVKAA